MKEIWFSSIHSLNNCMTNTTQNNKIVFIIISIVFVYMMNYYSFIVSTYLTRSIISFNNHTSQTTKSVIMHMESFSFFVILMVLIVMIFGVLIYFISTFSAKPFYRKFSSTSFRTKPLFNKFVSIVFSPIVIIYSSIFHKNSIHLNTINVKEVLQWQS